MNRLQSFFSKYGITIVFTLFALITSFYRYLPENVAYTVLKLPYIVILLLGCCILTRIIKKKYKPKGLPAVILILTLVLGCIYVFVTAWRYFSNGFDSARNSLYLAMTVLFGIVLFFAADSGLFSRSSFSLNLVILSCELNLMQLIVSAGAFGGVRGSFFLENIMVYDCIMTAIIPQLFSVLCAEKNQKLRWAAGINLSVGMAIILISGSRSVVIISCFILILCIIACCVMFFRRWKECTAVFLGTVVLVAVMLGFNLYHARNSVDRVLGWSMNSMDLENEFLSEDFTAPGAHSETAALIQESDNMRQNLWELSVKEIKKSPFIGTGVVFFDCDYGDVVLQQSSHNIVLEAWLVFGGVGMAVYGVLLLSVILYFIFRIKKKRALWTLLSLCAILAPAMVHTLMSMIFVTSFFWLLAGCGYQDMLVPEENS